MVLILMDFQDKIAYIRSRMNIIKHKMKFYGNHKSFKNND